MIEPDTLKRIRDAEVQRFLNEKWAQIVQLYDPDHFILFGSRINGVPHEWSDIDMIIVSKAFRDTRWIERPFDFWNRVRPHLATTTLCYSPEEFAEARTGIGLVPDACREGLWIR